MRSIGLYVFALSYTLAVAAHTLPIQWRYWVALAMLVIVLMRQVQVRTRVGVTCIVLLAVIVASVRMYFIPIQIPESFAELVDQKVTLRGTVTALPDEREASDRLIILVTKGDAKTRIIASVPSYPKVHVGDEIDISGTLKLPQPFETDGGRTFSYPEFLRKDGIFAIVQPAFAKRVGVSENLWLRFLRLLETFKEWFMHLIETALPEPASALAAGLLVGGKQGLGERLIDAFTRAGMLQIVVLSGFNVMIVADTILTALARLPRRIGFTLASMSIVCFVLIAGAGSSALRAGAMALFAIYTRATGRHYEVLRSLTAALIVLGIWNPLMLIFDPGFQFSFIATLGLVLGTPVIEPRLQFLRNAFLIEAFSTTLAAECSLLPLLLWQTGNLSLVSVFANIAAMPVIPFCMASSVIAALLSIPLSFISSTFPLIAGLPAYLGLTYVISIAQVSAALPLASVVIPAFPFWVVIVSYAGLGWVVMRHNGKRSPELESVSH